MRNGSWKIYALVLFVTIAGYLAKRELERVESEHTWMMNAIQQIKTKLGLP